VWAKTAVGFSTGNNTRTYGGNENRLAMREGGP